MKKVKKGMTNEEMESGSKETENRFQKKKVTDGHFFFPFEKNPTINLV